MITMEQFNRLRKLSIDAPSNLSEYHWQQMIDYAEAKEDMEAYWQECAHEYREQIKRLRSEMESSEVTPPDTRVKEAREGLMAQFKIKAMDAETANLVEFLIRQLPQEKFQEAIPERHLLDAAFFNNVKRLVEVEKLSLMDAYKANDEHYDQPKGSTAYRFSEMRKKTAKGAEWSAAGVKKVKTEQPLHPEIIEFCKKHDQRGKS